MHLIRIAMACLALISLPLHAANIELAPAIEGEFVMPFPFETMEGLLPPGQPQSFKDHKHIRVSGDIALGDADRLIEVLATLDPFDPTVVSFDSPGGDYREGLQLADILQARNVSTYVDAGDTCLSACALAFLGGRQEVIRRILYAPRRFVHMDATLGFHAPFNTSYPAIPTLNDQTMRLVADLFYGQAREAIRALQTRTKSLEISSDFVFDLLGKGPEEFLYIDRYREAAQNKIYVLADGLSRPQHLGATGARLACALAFDIALSGFGDSIVPNNWSDVASSSFLQRPLSFGDETTVSDDGNGRPVFLVKAIFAGRGVFTCRVSAGNDGVWRLELNGDLPTEAELLGQAANNAGGGLYDLSNINILGTMLPWSALGQEDLYITGDSDIFAIVPEELQRADGPSFNCGGELDPAAEIICRFPILARADATMVAVYLKKREEGAANVRNVQREWVARRNALCRPEWVDQTDQTELTLGGYCLLESTMAQIQTLLERL